MEDDLRRLWDSTTIIVEPVLVQAPDRQPNPKGMGSDQWDLLHALREHGEWFKGRAGGYWCRWVWNTDSQTTRMLDALVRRGYVVRDARGVYTPVDCPMPEKP
jgi:DNA-binding MarR family transcriptional regulator